MAFIDEATLSLQAGNGGDGVVRWRREKYKPNGGPGGGDGGRGGDVYVVGTNDIGVLEDYRFSKEFKAVNGEPGGNFGRTGKSSGPLKLRVPVGSHITNTETGETYDILKHGQEVLLLRGGSGGYGNEHFKSSTNTTPYESTPGEPGERSEFYIELRLIADVGLIGKPSAGKSTLLNMMTNAKAKTAAYHFTTLSPNLGVLPGGTIVADIPGLIEGAHTGKGLGMKFLRHIKRTRLLAHLVSAEEEQPLEAYNMIRNELQSYDETLLDNPEIIIVSKSDVVDKDELNKLVQELQAATNNEVVSVSSYDDESLKNLQDLLHKRVQREVEQAVAKNEEES